MAIWLHRAWRGTKWALSIIVIAGCGFVSLALVSAAFPTDGRPQSPLAAPAIQLCAGKAHTDFAVPLQLARSDTFGPIANHLPGLADNDYFVLIGWGDYRFFTEVPTLSELRPDLALGALSGQHDTALRIQLIRTAYMPNYCRTLALDQQGQDAIAQHIRDSIAEPTIPLKGDPFGATYLKSNQRYGIFHTCNDWTSDALRKAGLPTARWNAPFAFSVTWPLQSHAND